MSRCPAFTFQILIMSKWFAKHISTNVSFEITIRKRHVCIEIRWPWIRIQYFYLGIWNYYRTKMIVLPSFQFATRLNSQNRNENEIINELWNIDFYMNIGISNWNNGSFDPTKMNSLIYFSSLHDYGTPSNWNSLVHTSWGETERCEKRAFQLQKCEKPKLAET